MDLLRLLYRLPILVRFCAYLALVTFCSFMGTFGVPSAMISIALIVGGYGLFLLPELINIIGVLYLHDNQNDTALRLFQFGHEIDPDNYFLLVNLGVVRLKQGEPAEAKTIFSQAIAAHPKKTIAYYNRSAANYALKNFADCESDAALLLDIKPNDLRGQLCKTSSMIGQGRYGEALTLFEQMHPGDQYRDRVNLGKLLCKATLYRIEEAEQEWGSSKIYSSDIRHFGKCYLAWMKGEYPEVLSLTSEIKDNAQNGEMFLYFRSLSYAYLGESELAYKAAFNIFMQKRHRLLGMQALLTILVDTTFDTVAADLCQRIEREYPDSFAALMSHALYALKSKDLALMAHYLERLESTLPANAVVKAYRAIWLQLSGKSDEALSLARHAVKIAPLEAVAWHGLSYVQLQRNDLAEALKSAKEATGIQHYNASFYSHIADIHELSGNLDEARSARERSQMLSKNYDAGVAKAIREQPMHFLDTDSGTYFDSILALNDAIK